MKNIYIGDIFTVVVVLINGFMFVQECIVHCFRWNFTPFPPVMWFGCLTSSCIICHVQYGPSPVLYNKRGGQGTKENMNFENACI